MKEIGLNGCLDGAADYTEFRAQRNQSTTVRMLNGDLLLNSESVSSGLSCRTFLDGEWGFACSSRSQTNTIAELVGRAEANARFMAKMRRERDYTATIPDECFKFHRDYVAKFTPLSRQDLVDFVKDLHDKTSSKYPDLKSIEIVVDHHELEKNLVNSIGSSAYHVLPRTSLYVVFSYELHGEVVSLMNRTSDFGRPGEVLAEPDHITNNLEQHYKLIRDKAGGKHAEAGVKDVIISPAVTGVLAHEAIGHPAEADLVRAGSVAGNFRGEKVGTDLVTMVDYAHSYLGNELPVPVYIDDEGVAGKDVVLIDQGVFQGYMHNRELSDYYSARPTGNARAFNYSDEPLVRMRNTIIEPGNSKLDDMIKSIDDGYYFIERTNGQADLTSEFMFGVTMGYEIKKGKLGKAIKDTTISGVAFDMLSTVDMVSDEFDIDCSGFCGKKQRMIVSFGGPSIKCRLHVGG